MPISCLEELEAVMARWPRSEWDRALKTLSHRRLENYGREKRLHLSPARKRDLYARQNGRCANPKCSKPFRIMELEADHIDPNRQDFNARSNWQLLCRDCHKDKGAKSVMDQTKFYNRTAVEILGDEP